MNKGLTIAWLSLLALLVGFLLYLRLFSQDVVYRFHIEGSDSVVVKKKQLSFVIGALGPDLDMLEKHLDKLPKNIAIAVTPYAHDVGSFLCKVQLNGYSVFIDLQMPTEFTEYGPYTITADVVNNEKILQEALKKMTGCKGITSFDKSNLMQNSSVLSGIKNFAQKEQLIFITPYKVDPNIYSCDIMLDEDFSENGLKEALDKLDSLLEREERVIAFAHAYPVVLEKIIDWTQKNKDVLLTTF